MLLFVDAKQNAVLSVDAFKAATSRISRGWGGKRERLTCSGVQLGFAVERLLAT
jgi:hypothetical protein